MSLTGVSSLPIRKHNSLPSYCQDAVFKATEIEKMHTSRSSKNSNLASAKGTMQTAITDYVKTGSVLDTDLVLEESLFDANRFSPIRNNAAASTPNCNKTVKRKVFAPISCNEQVIFITYHTLLSLIILSNFGSCRITQKHQNFLSRLFLGNHQTSKRLMRRMLVIWTTVLDLIRPKGPQLYPRARRKRW